MKIAIDGRTMIGQKSGLGCYAESLIENLHKIDKNISIEIIKPENNNDLSTPKRIFWDQVLFPIQSMKTKPDLIHKPSFSVPVFSKSKIVVTVHDLIPIIFPKNLSFFSRMFWTKIMPFSYKYADHIITDSEWSKKDIVRLLKINPKKITVTPLAARENFLHKPDSKKIDYVQNKFNTGKKYILTVSNLEPRKNFPFLIKVYKEILEKNPNFEYKLVIVGKKSWGTEKILNDAKGKFSDKIIVTGYVEEKELPCLYYGATLFAFPSLYEGFGLTPLEAMACGVPVICSNASSLPEVCGDAAIMLDPTDLDAWVKNIEKMLKSTSLRQQYSNKALKQASKFSWQKTAEKTLKVYRSQLK